MSQNQAVLTHLKRGRRLTAAKAWRELGTMRLAARIHELRADGHNIVKEIVKMNNSRVAIYYLSKHKPGP